MTRYLRTRLPVTALLAAAALATGITHAGAAESGSEGGWKYTAAIYLYAAGVGGQTKSGGDVDIGFDTLLRDLNMGFMGGFGARKGKWSLATDAIYLDVSQDNSGKLNFPGDVEVATSSTVKLKGWIVTPFAGYNLVDTEQGSLDVIAGARYLYLKASLDLTASALGVTRSAQISESGSAWNGIAGVRGHLNLAPGWFVPYYADVGTGESKLTWQLFAGVGYRFKGFDAVLGYRYMDWRFKSDAPVFNDLNLSGPILGARFEF